MFTGRNLHQGDTQWFELNSLPEDATKIEKQFVAKSEKTGHAHALCGDYEMFNVKNTEGFFVKVGEGGATLNHTAQSNLTPEYWDTNKELEIADHKPTRFKKGIYYVGIQKRKRHFAKRAEKFGFQFKFREKEIKNEYWGNVMD